MEKIIPNIELTYNLSPVINNTDQLHVLTNSRGSVSLFLDLWRDISVFESFYVLFLNIQLQVLCYKSYTHGSADSCYLAPGVVAKTALVTNSNRVIIAHNHPSGECKPSDADDKFTKELKDALNLVGVQLLDHIILVPGSTPHNNYYSYVNSCSIF